MGKLAIPVAEMDLNMRTLRDWCITVVALMGLAGLSGLGGCSSGRHDRQDDFRGRSAGYRDHDDVWHREHDREVDRHDGDRHDADRRDRDDRGRRD